ncbi:MAG: GDP-mannose 4,6 dehydratase [Mycobacterium sp.]|nr:GDP-mannose 4,6 dehydratase [Mycobacterium sp.]
MQRFLKQGVTYVDVGATSAQWTLAGLTQTGAVYRNTAAEGLECKASTIKLAIVVDLLKTTKILVTGAAGFIGMHAALRLLNRGGRVALVVRI